MILRGYQQDAINDVFDFWKNPELKDQNCLLVAPTGAGKSVILAEIARRLTTGKNGEHRKILILAHRKELVSQNAEKFQKLCPEISCGVYSAGLGIRKIRQVTFAGIQSVFKKGADFGFINLVMIDECHTLSRKSTGMYQQLITKLKETNPKLKIFGCSATPYRLDSGSLVGGDDAIFHDIAHEIEISKLIAQDYLVKLISKSAKTQADLNDVSVRGGDYVATELDMIMSVEDLVNKTCDEIISRAGSDRKSWLLFCVSVKHVGLVKEAMKSRGVSTEAVTGDTWPMERDRLINEFKAGKFKCLVNCEVLTTGFDAPSVDLVGLLRPTKSCGLYVQMVGRGTRLSPETGKKDCLVLDFGGNIARFGPVDTIKIRHNKKGGKSKVVKKSLKECPECGEWNELAAKECAGCGYEYPGRSIVHAPIPFEGAVINEIEEWEVESIECKRHSKVDKPDSFRIKYNCKGNVYKNVSEYLCFEHGGFAARKAKNKWREITGEKEAPNTVQEALDQMFKIPPHKSIKVIADGKFYRILERRLFTSGEILEAEHDPIFEKYGVNI